ncbi:MAG: DUF3352 domain-containing protein [Solirubrobacterales bacterium]
MRIRRGDSERSHPINDVGDSEGKKALGEKSTEGKKRRRARFLGRLSLPRPKLTKPSLSAPKVPQPKVPERADDLWFRLVTRLRAIGYWLREKAQALWRLAKRAAAASGNWWSKRSPATRMRIFAVAGVVVLYLIVKFLPVPGVPCEISAARECAPSNDTIAYVPRDALLYAHVTVNSDSHQWDLAGDLHDELPNFAALLQSDTSSLATPAGRPVDLGREVLPWAKDDLSLLGVPGPKGTTAETYIAGVGDSAKADRFLAALSPGGQAKQAKVGDATLNVYPTGLATARSGDAALFGGAVAVRAALAARSGSAPRLEGSDQDAARAALPDVRLAEVYLSQAGVQRFLAGRPGSATQLGTFVDYGATTGMAASLRARDDGVEVNLVSDLDPKLEQRSPTVFASLPRFEPGLADEAGTDALAYIGVGDLGPALSEALATAGAGAQGLAGSLRTLAQSLKQQAGVDPLKDLLPALGGQAALVAEPTGGVPYASLIVDGVDEQKAGDALAALQQPLLRSIGTGGRQVPSFQTREIDNVAVHSVQISPTVDLSYAIFDGKLVISTQPEGISQVRSSGGNLAGTGAYDAATDRLPDSVSALVFLNLNEVLGLAQQAGLGLDPLFASLSEDISRVQSLGLAVRGSDDELRSELFLAIHH